MLVLAYRVPGERNFTADFASRQLGIDESEAGRILDHMYQTRMLQRSEIRLADRILYAYARHDETLIVPFLYFAGELMHNSAVYYSLPMRAEPIFKAPLGTDSFSPDWCDDTTQKELDLPFRRRLRRRLRDKLLFHGLLFINTRKRAGGIFVPSGAFGTLKSAISCSAGRFFRLQPGRFSHPARTALRMLHWHR